MNLQLDSQKRLKIKNERRDTTTDTTEKQRISNYYEHLYTNILGNLEEMNKFLATYNLQRLNHEEIENLNRPITTTEMSSVIKISPKTKVQEQMASLVNSIQHLKKNQYHLLKPFEKKQKRRKYIQTHFMRPNYPTKTRQGLYKKTTGHYP